MDGLVLGKVSLEDPIAKGRGGSVVHQAQAVEAGDAGCVQHGMPLGICVVHRNRDNAVCHCAAHVPLANGLQVPKDHAHDCLGGVCHLLAEGLDADEAAAVTALYHAKRHARDICLHIRLVEFLA
mmetsp:Transcript_35480/g.100457  ORF Transcript_35480/g.100457 Transcript_35480/m.100457 type:complete len:125 (-) Transcript_35480:457-831(-)